MNKVEYEKIREMVNEWYKNKDRRVNESKIDRDRRIWNDKVKRMSEKQEIEDERIKNRSWIKKVWDWMMWLMDGDCIGYGSKTMRKWG